MKKLIYSLSVIIVALSLFSCSTNLKPLNSGHFNCHPNPLEVKAGKVDATIDGIFPTKYFDKKSIITITPVLVSKINPTLTYPGTPTKFQGEKVIGNNKVIKYKEGGNYTVKASFDYVPDMAQSELRLVISVTKSNKKKYTLPEVKVADGVFTTAELAERALSGSFGPVIIPDKFQQIIQETQEADIKFLIQQADLRSSETNSLALVALTQKIKEAQGISTQEISGLEISGYASPDGAFDLNKNLAEKREKVTTDYINRELNKIRSSVTIDTKFTAEDWEGFQALMEKSNIQDKQVIIRVLSMYSDPEQREREIKNLSAAYKSIADDILPKLRRSRLKLTVDITGKTDEAIVAWADVDPNKLSLEELLYAATLVKTVSEKEALYKKVTERYPREFRGFNNLGVIQYSQGQHTDAFTSFAKALSLNPKSPDANYNAGLVALAQNKLSQAEEMFGNSAGTTGNLDNALGTVYAVKGDYYRANAALEGVASNNAALIQILQKDYKSARTTLENIVNPNGYTAYLGAILAARTNDRNAVYSNVSKAVSIDSSLKDKIAKDIEFSKYFSDANFTSLLK
ncbi:MAG: tetratricopeptide repeat protein [Paludibacter sp.]|nr:tetratricopeptide repeat protein [Paludibacter sp.]